jgi:RHS repeat-associated protein
MTGAWGPSALTGSYYNEYRYDADGRRVRRKTEAGEVWQVYGLDGKLLAEYGTNAAPSAPRKEYGYRAGELLVTAEAGFTWVDDSLPAGAWHCVCGVNEAWNWVGSPAPVSGSYADQTQATAGLHQQFFEGATQTMQVGAGETLVAYVYLDPANPPSEIMIQWNATTGGWEHRAYWGANLIGWGADGTGSRRHMGPLPAAGQWVRLEVPAAAVGLEGKTVHGLAVTLYNGRATWDKLGKGSVRWMVSDHLGTPRMTADQTGSLQGVRRHDYLPFGEEIGDGVGGRTTQRGYVTDGVRQKFVGKERDNETGLDYSVHRYYAAAHGRFTTPDPIFVTSERTHDPQSLNLYAYARNNPFRFTDPDGLYLRLVGDAADIMRFLEELERATGLKLKYNPVTGMVELAAAPPAKLSANGQEVLNLIQDPNHHVALAVINDPQGGKPVTVGRLLGVDEGRARDGTKAYQARHAVDLADVDTVAKGGNTTAGDIVIHETVEAYRAAKRAPALLNESISQEAFAREVHDAGIGAENNNRGTNRPARTTNEGLINLPRQYGGQPLRGLNGERFFYIDFTTHVEILTLDASGNKVLQSNVVKK